MISGFRVSKGHLKWPPRARREKGPLLGRRVSGTRRRGDACVALAGVESSTALYFPQGRDVQGRTGTLIKPAAVPQRENARWVSG